MTTYESDITLGRTYRHSKLGLEGVAESIHFYANACERVMLIYMHDGDVKEAGFDAVDLINVATEKRAESKQNKPGGPARTGATASMTAENLIEIRSQAAMGRDQAEPDRPHCARCADVSLVGTVLLVPLTATVETPGYSAALCDGCLQRVIDVLVNPHLFITALTTNPTTMEAEIVVDGTGVSRTAAVEMLINAAEMLNTGEAEVVARYDPATYQDES